MNKNLISVLSIVLAVLLYPTVLQGLYDETKSLLVENETLSNTIKKAEEFIEIRNTLIEKSEQFTPDELSRLEQILPKEINPLQLALDIEHIGNVNGLILNGGVAIDIPEDEEDQVHPNGTRNLKEVSLGLSFVGQYRNLEGFLNELSESLTLFDVKEIGFSGGREAAYDYTIRAVTYELKDAFE